MRPLDAGRSRLILTLALLALHGDSGAALAGQAADGPLPPIAPKELAARIRQSRDRYDDVGLFEVAFDEVRDTNSGNAADQKPILVIFHGLARFASNGVQWRAEHDGKIPSAGSTRLSPDHWVTGFDGSRLYDWQISHQRVILYETHHTPRHWSPRNLIWERADGLIELLEGAGPPARPVAIRSEVVDGRPCYIVEVGKAGDEFQGRHVISPGQGHLPVRTIQRWKGKPYVTYELNDLREVAPGLWAPGRIEFDWQNLHRDGTTSPEIRRSIRVVDYRPHAAVNPAALAFDLPHDVTVTDPRLGVSYFNDPWWPEVGPLLRERFDWPRTDLSALGELRVGSDRSLDDRPSPPLRVANWLRGEPPQAAAPKGKVVVLLFGDSTADTRLRLAPALKKLVATYRPTGLEAMVIVPPGADVDAVRQAAEAYDMNYAIGVDSPGKDGQGQTAVAYGIKSTPTAVLIDREGKVRAREGEKLSEVLPPLLAGASGAQPQPALSFQRPEIPQDALQAVGKVFDEGVSRSLAAHPEGEITCRVVDAQGQAIPGARVSVRLGLTVLVAPDWGAFWATGYRKPLGRDGSTGPEGQLVIGGLCKGTYTVKAEAPGKAWAERKVSLGTSTDTASTEIVLPRGLTIAGRVLDEEGEPVPGATIEADQWAVTEDGRTTITNCPWLKPATVDAEGRFRFADLPGGLYSFEVTAPGFQKKELRNVTAGKENLSVTLKRSE
jgi:hypothetical protein